MHRALRIPLIATFSALAIALNYAFAAIPNVQLFDFIVYLTAFSFGFDIGAGVAVVTWLVYGYLNPWGFFLPILAATTVSEPIYAIAGTAAARSPRLWKQTRIAALVHALNALWTTLVYDLLTASAYALVFHVPLLAALLAQIPFTILHLAANIPLFSLTPLIASYLDRSLPAGLVRKPANSSI
ncbi:hypothetical protein DRN94_000225 [archaeon]|nr:hypothetical protein [archaeon]